MKIPLHSKIRKSMRNLLNKTLSLIFNNKPSTNTIDINSIQTIAIVRPNYRIGNLLFLTPLINEIGVQNPDIKIDLFVGIRAAGAILEPMPNIDEVIDIPRELLKNPLKLYKFIKNARKKKYDLTINIVPGSVSSQIVAMLVNSKYKMSFYDEKSWMPLTHVVQQTPQYIHTSLRPLELLKVFNITKYKHPQVLDIKLTKDEINYAQYELKKLLEKNKLQHKKNRVFALFRNARFDKRIEDSWWKELVTELKKLDESLIIIDILSPDIPKKLNDDVLEYFNKNLRSLGAFFSVCDAYISADTGPLHLAGASGGKAIALFNATDTITFGTLGKNNKTLDIKSLSPAEVAKLII